jgi:hypothetical protein
VCHPSPQHALVEHLPRRAKMSPTATAVSDHADLPVSDCNRAAKGGDLARRGRAPGPFSLDRVS